MFRNLINKGILIAIKTLLRGKRVKAERNGVTYELEMWNDNKARATDDKGGYFVFDVEIINN